MIARPIHTSGVPEQLIPATSVLIQKAMGGLSDFPQAKFICMQSAYVPLAKANRFKRILHGFIQELLPENFIERCIFAENLKTIQLDKTFAPFQTRYDLFGDKSLIAVPLPGHVEGQLGLIFRDKMDRQIFLIADACWFSQSFQENILPHPIARIAIADWKKYSNTIQMLRELNRHNPELAILPSHCQEAASLFNLQRRTTL